MIILFTGCKSASFKGNGYGGTFITPANQNIVPISNHFDSTLPQQTTIKTPAFKNNIAAKKVNYQSAEQAVVKQIKNKLNTQSNKKPLEKNTKISLIITMIFLFSIGAIILINALWWSIPAMYAIGVVFYLISLLSPIIGAIYAFKGSEILKNEGSENRSKKWANSLKVFYICLFLTALIVFLSYIIYLIAVYS